MYNAYIGGNYIALPQQLHFRWHFFKINFWKKKNSGEGYIIAAREY